jgi:hypothetical protein
MGIIILRTQQTKSPVRNLTGLFYASSKFL